MQPKITAPQPEAFPRERFEAMIASEPFQIYAQRIQSELGRARQALESPQTSMEEMYRAQGAVIALNGVLALPRLILAVAPNIVHPPAGQRSNTRA
jgi:hypothetical protein